MFKTIGNNKGFSLVEMAIALVILAVVAGVIYLAAQPYVAKADVQAAGQQLESFRHSLISYYADNGKKYPDAFSKLTPNYLPSAPSASYKMTCTPADGVTFTVNAGDVDGQTKILANYKSQLGATACVAQDGGAGVGPQVFCTLYAPGVACN